MQVEPDVRVKMTKMFWQTFIWCELQGRGYSGSVWVPEPDCRVHILAPPLLRSVTVGLIFLACKSDKNNVCFTWLLGALDGMIYGKIRRAPGY